MGHGFDICPKCGCDLWEAHAEEEKKKQIKKYPNECFCFAFGDIPRRDVAKDTFIEKRIVNIWTGPFRNTHEDQEHDTYKCHICGKEYIYPEIYYG